jgi:hypothetical protein
MEGGVSRTGEALRVGDRSGRCTGPNDSRVAWDRISACHADGYDVDQIANDIGMSSQMVERYMRFKDQMEIAERSLARLRLVANPEPRYAETVKWSKSPYKVVGSGWVGHDERSI